MTLGSDMLDEHHRPDKWDSLLMSKWKSNLEIFYQTWRFKTQFFLIQNIPGHMAPGLSDKQMRILYGIWPFGDLTELRGDDPWRS